MHLRPATVGDAKLLFEWRNDPATREGSRNTKPLVWAEHVSWLERSLSTPSRKLYIAEEGVLAVGTVRADDDTDGYTEISYTIAPEARGKGYGKRMLLQFVHEQLAGKKIKAEIKKGGNEASEAVAKELGLSPAGERASEDPEDPRPLILWKQ